MLANDVKETVVNQFALVLPLALASGLAACASTGDEPAAPPADAAADGAGMCNAAPAQQYVGSMADEATVQAAVRASGAAQSRVIDPDTMVTMEYREDRVNLWLDAAGKIDRITCG